MIRPMKPIATLAVLLAFTIASGGWLVAAQENTPQSWPEVKCSRYKKAWSDTLARRGDRGLGREFLVSHEAFLASGCTARAAVCPRSAEELEIANVMVVLAMNAGTASTFLPFSCRK
jgi:hypothetical protein